MFRVGIILEANMIYWGGNCPRSRYDVCGVGIVNINGDIYYHHCGNGNCPRSRYNVFKEGIVLIADMMCLGWELS